MLVKFKTDKDKYVYVNARKVDILEEYTPEEGLVAIFQNGKSHTCILVKGTLDNVASQINIGMNA